MALNLTQRVLDGVVILLEPKDATAAAARKRLALVAPTLGGYLVGARADGLGYCSLDSTAESFWPLCR